MNVHKLLKKTVNYRKVLRQPQIEKKLKKKNHFSNCIVDKSKMKMCASAENKENDRERKKNGKIKESIK